MTVSATAGSADFRPLGRDNVPRLFWGQKQKTRAAGSRLAALVGSCEWLGEFEVRAEKLVRFASRRRSAPPTPAGQADQHEPKRVQRLHGTQPGTNASQKPTPARLRMSTATRSQQLTYITMEFWDNTGSTRYLSSGSRTETTWLASTCSIICVTPLGQWISTWAMTAAAPMPKWTSVRLDDA